MFIDLRMLFFAALAHCDVVGCYDDLRFSLLDRVFV